MDAIAQDKSLRDDPSEMEAFNRLAIVMREWAYFTIVSETELYNEEAVNLAYEHLIAPHIEQESGRTAQPLSV